MSLPISNQKRIGLIVRINEKNHTNNLRILIVEINDTSHGKAFKLLIDSHTHTHTHVTHKTQFNASEDGKKCLTGTFIYFQTIVSFTQLSNQSV